MKSSKTQNVSRLQKPRKDLADITADEIQTPDISLTSGASKNRDIEDSLKFNRRTLLILLGILGVALFFMIKIFLVPVILAICFTTLFYPLYSWFVKITHGKKLFSSICCCLVLFFGLLIPVYILLHLIASEFISLYSSAEPQIKDLIYRSDHGPLAQLLQNPLFNTLHSMNIDWESIIKSALKTAGHFGTTILNKTSTEFFSLLMTMAIMFFTMFYLFLDGDKLLKKLQYLSPLRQKYDELLFKRFLMISRATIRGTIVIGINQGLFGALTFLIFGIKSWLLWGFVMLILSLIPFTGAWIVMLPAAVLQAIYGHYWKAAGIAFMSIAVVSSIDNLLRPRLVGKEAKMHDLLVLFSTLGGIAVYGIMGFIIGPVIAALFLALLEIYGMEYNTILETPVHNNQT